MVHINSDIPEPFREFLGVNCDASKDVSRKEQDISATSMTNLSVENNTERGRADMQDFLFLAAILMLCDD